MINPMKRRPVHLNKMRRQHNRDDNRVLKISKVELSGKRKADDAFMPPRPLPPKKQLMERCSMREEFVKFRDAMVALEQAKKEADDSSPSVFESEEVLDDIMDELEKEEVKKDEAFIEPERFSLDRCCDDIDCDCDYVDSNLSNGIELGSSSEEWWDENGHSIIVGEMLSDDEIDDLGSMVSFPITLEEKKFDK